MSPVPAAARGAAGAALAGGNGWSPWQGAETWCSPCALQRTQGPAGPGRGDPSPETLWELGSSKVFQWDHLISLLSLHCLSSFQRSEAYNLV